jgi:hypothetical protein
MQQGSTLLFFKRPTVDQAAARVNKFSQTAVARRRDGKNITPKFDTARLIKYKTRWTRRQPGIMRL